MTISNTLSTNMKLHLPLLLRASLLAAACPFAAGADDAATMGADWGNTIYMGDSISHGFNVQPYRWFLFKNLVDNGIAQTEVGIQTGYYHSSISTESTYGARSFDNLHATQSGITAAQVAGEGSGKLDGSGLVDWLGQDAAYTGSYKVHSAAEPGTLAAPDTAFIMMGTNDIFNATSVGYLNNSTLAAHTANMQRYLGTVVTALKQANPEVSIVINSIPTWSENRAANSNGSAENWQALTSLNTSLKEWAEQQEGVTFVDINKGMVDVANTAKPGAADAAFCSDTQHPNAQGNLIIAGNMAQQLGYAGRTAGQLRVAAGDTEVFTHQAADLFSADSTTHANVSLTGDALVLGNGATLSASWGAADDLETGFTVDFGLADGLGNGSEGGWNTTSQFSLSIGDGTHAGTLNVDEAYIKWGSTLLYSMDTSSLTDSLRVSYVYGNASQGLKDGFYVWMGDMLIGEALSSTGSTSGLSLTNGSGSELTLTHLSMASGAWAPTTTLYTNGNPLIAPSAYLPVVEKNLTGISLGTGTNALRNQSGIAAGNHAVIAVEDGTLAENTFAVNKGDYAGDVTATLKGTITKTVAGTYHAAHDGGTLGGSISLTIAQGFSTTGSNPTWGAFVGASNGSTVNGDVSLVLSSENLVVDHSLSGLVQNCALTGSYGGTIGGAVHLEVNAGTLNGNVFGAILNAANSVGQGTHVTINGGTINGHVYGGSYNASNGGTIHGGTAVTIGGAATISGNVYAGGVGSTINGGTLITVKDAGTLSAFADYAGTLSGSGTRGVINGTRALCFDNVQLPSIKASLQNFDALSLTGNSNVGLSSLGGATTLSIASGSRLALIGGSHSAIVSNSGTVAVEKGAALTVNGAGQDGNLFGKYELNGGSLTITGYDHLSTAIDVSAGSLSNSSGTLLDGGVKVHATGAVVLDGVALGDISSLSVQTGGSVAATLDAGSVQLNGITSLVVTTDAANTQNISLRAASANLSMGAGNAAAPFAGLALGENGSLTLDSLNIALGSDYALVTSGEGRLFVNQGSLSAGAVSITAAAALGANQTLSYTDIGSEGGNSYVGYKLFTTVEQSGQSYGNEATAIANTAQGGNTSGNIAVSIDGGSLSTQYLVAHSGARTGDVQVTLNGEFSIPNSTGYNVAHYKGVLDGDVSLVLGSEFSVKDGASLGSFVGANGANAHVKGDIEMEFSSGDLTVGTTHQGCAVAGVSGAKADGSVSITIQAGTFNGDVYGGAVVKDASSIGKGTQVTLSGGTVTGNVYGAGKVGSIAAGGSAVTVTGDARVQSATTGGKAIISAGGTGGTIHGDTRLTVQGVEETDSFASFSGILSGNEGSELTGTRILCFDKVQFGAVGITLRNFSHMELKGQSTLSLSSLGGATHLCIEEGSRLSLNASSELELSDVVLHLGADSQMEVGYILNNEGGSLNLGALTLNLSEEVCAWITAPVSAMLYTETPAAPANAGVYSGELVLGRGAMSATRVDLMLAEEYQNHYDITDAHLGSNDNGETVLYYTITEVKGVPEPTSASLSLLALAALAARRRRR